MPRRRTTLEQLIERRVQAATVLTVTSATERLGEEMARADQDTRIPPHVACACPRGISTHRVGFVDDDEQAKARAKK